jgi:predicted transcriptional regulator
MAFGYDLSAVKRVAMNSFTGLRQEAKFLISQQKYLEYLETSKTTMALHVLRNELAPLHMDPEQLLPLSRFVTNFSCYIRYVGLLTPRHV